MRKPRAIGFWIDADERVTPELRAVIEKTSRNGIHTTSRRISQMARRTQYPGTLDSAFRLVSGLPNAFVIANRPVIGMECAARNGASKGRIETLDANSCTYTKEI